MAISCVNSLKYVPIDRAFVMDINNDPNDAAKMQAIIAMVRRLKIAVTAEAVE